jgi:multiple sugar transport system substrate-binding protein
MLTRRHMLHRTATTAVLATTAPWWGVRRAHAARQTKLVVWAPATLAPQVDKILQEQCYTYAKQAGLRAHDLDYSIIGTGQLLPKLIAALEAGNPPDITLLSPGSVSQMQQVPGGLFPAALVGLIHNSQAYGVPHAVSPWPLITRMDMLEAAKVEPPTTWEAFIEVCAKVQKPPKLTGYGLCLGLHTDTDNNVMNMIWCYGGQLVEADNQTVALHSQGTVAAVQLMKEMYHKHKIIPKGALGWDNTGNNKAYQSRQVLCVLNPSSIYAHLAASNRALYNSTGLLPVPAGPAGAIAELTMSCWGLFTHNPYPEVAKGLAAYWTTPEHLRVLTEEGEGRWGPPYPQLYASAFWQRPVFQHWRAMLERGRQFPHPGAMYAAAGEVITTNVLARMMHRVLVEHWDAEKAVEEAHKKTAEIYARHAGGRHTP